MTQTTPNLASPTSHDTLVPPPKRCTCCGEAVTYAEWMANPTRRHWPGLGLEIQEHTCRSTLSVVLHGDGAQVAA